MKRYYQPYLKQKDGSYKLGYFLKERPEVDSSAEMRKVFQKQKR